MRIVKLLDSNVFFDQDFYSLESAETFSTRSDAINHFLKIGEANGFNPSPYFMWSWVKLQNSTLSIDNYLTHLTDTPLHPLLDLSKIKKFISANNWRHTISEWINNSPLTELVSDIFLHDAHISMAPHVYFSSITSRRSRFPLESAFFSSQWYSMAYSDVREANINPLQHFLASGWKEGRDPSPSFSANAYLTTYLDVRESGANPLLHFANFGSKEGRNAPATEDYQLAVRYHSLAGTSPNSYVAFEGPSDFPPEEFSSLPEKHLVIVIPFYKREDLVDNLLGSLLACAEELKTIGTLIVLVNDSPDYTPLDEAICRWFDDIEMNGIEAIYLCNSVNRGFIYSSNTGIWISEKLGAHCLLLNSDTVVVAGAISEMLSILESDEKFGFVNPRTNNATIATYGSVPTDADSGYSSFRRTHSLLPRYQIVPVAVGFCLLIRAEVVRLFGYLDPVYGFGYNEENDFIMRANRRGYSSVLANHCFVAHLGKASFSVLCEDPNDFDNINQKIFFSRYPEFKPAITRYFSSSRYHAHRLTERENDVDIIIDIRTASKINNGTTKLIKALLPYLFTELRGLKLAVAAEPGVIDFLEIQIPYNVTTIDAGAIDLKAGLGFLFSQPFSNNVVDRLLLSCERVGFFMLDTIATDCLYIQQDGLSDLWDRVCGSGDLFIFNSDYTMSRFLNRFTFNADAQLLASTHSLNPEEYGDLAKSSRRYFKNSAPRVLLFGNHYEHKGLLPALNALNGKGFDVTVFGAALSRDDIVSYPAGQLSDASLDEIWSSADVLVFPSFYEGFGFPILEAVARRKPIVLLDSELNRELFNRLGKPPSFFFLKDFRRLDQVVKNAAEFNGPWPEIETMRNDGWARSAQEIAGAIRDTLVKPIAFDKIARRLSVALNA